MTTTNDELTRLRAAFAEPALSAIRAPEPAACPASDRIWLAVRGELPADELREIVDHLADCPSCAEDWRIAMVFEEEARAAAVAQPQPLRAVRAARFHSMRYRAWTAVAATILVAVVGFRMWPPKPAPYRSAGGPARVESLVEKDAALPADRFLLRWKGVPEAASYDVKILTLDETATPKILEQTRVTDTHYQVPESDLAGLRPGAKILWTVIPVSKDGGRLQPLTSTAYLAGPVSGSSDTR